MSRPPIMKDIAAACGVSVMTVSRAYKRDSSVSEATRERIITIGTEMGYMFDSGAANLRTQRSHFVAVTIPSLNNANFAETVEAMTPALTEHGLQILLGHTNYDLLREERLISELLQRRPEAIILTGTQHTDATTALLRRSGLPVIETWDVNATPIGHTVGFSNAAAMSQLVAHLVTRGYRRIAFLGGDAAADSRGASRRAGFQTAMREFGLDPTWLVPTGPPPTLMHQGRLGMAALLEQWPDCEAVVCVSDPAAFGALTECQRRGIRVPDDIAVTGFGAFDIAEMAIPALTTVDVHAREIGQLAAELACRLLRSAPGLSGPTHLTVEPVLKIGQSTR